MEFKALKCWEILKKEAAKILNHQIIKDS